MLKNCMEHNPTGGTLPISGKENPLYTEIKIEDEGPRVETRGTCPIFLSVFTGENRHLREVLE